jgi:hypothetical protein
MSDGKTCPECHTDSLHRSHRRKLDWIFHIIGYRTVRCSNCSERFYAPPPRQAHQPHMGLTRLN